MDTKRCGHDVVVVGGSTGAVTPLKGLLGQLPADFAASMLITLHIPARGPGVLKTVASAAAHRPVEQAENGMSIVPGGIYVASPDKHLLLRDDGTLHLGQGPRENMVRPSIDALFRSAAMAYGPRVVGVLLSGMLNDGVSGLEAIKRCGGLTVVQDPNDATADEMPRNALRAVIVDRIVSTKNLCDVVHELVQSPAGQPLDVPYDIQLDVQIAAGERVNSEIIGDVSDPAPFTCPTCGGVMSKIRTGKLLRFRCQVGHAMSAEVLAKQQESAVDEALRLALRVIEERAELITRMAQDSRVGERVATAEIYEHRADEYRNYAEVLRRAIVLSGEADFLQGKSQGS
jgi:two-component system, chemotaxis family, protein-glutamate methylesterase/glutaminase